MICAEKKTREMRKNTYDLVRPLVNLMMIKCVWFSRAFVLYHEQSTERGVKNVKNGLPEKLSALTDCSEVGFHHVLSLKFVVDKISDIDI